MAGTCINWINDVVAERAYSRKLEEEADAVGLDLMAWAGYDPRCMLDLWELMSCVEADAAASGRPVSVGHKYNFLRTHPATVERQKVTGNGRKYANSSASPNCSPVPCVFTRRRGPKYSRGLERSALLLRSSQR